MTFHNNNKNKLNSERHLPSKNDKTLYKANLPIIRLFFGATKFSLKKEVTSSKFNYLFYVPGLSIKTANQLNTNLILIDTNTFIKYNNTLFV